MHIAITPQKISSNEQSGFELFAQKNIFGKKAQTEILAKTSKNAKFRENCASERTF